MCFPWRVQDMGRIIAALQPSSGTKWHALYANGVCGWYTNEQGQPGVGETPPFWPGAAGVYCDLFALRDSKGATHSMDSSKVGAPWG